MRIAFAIMVGCLGCKGVLGIEEGTIVDAGSDDDVLVDAPACFGMEPYVVCPGDAGGPFMLPSTGVIDTDRDCTLMDTTDGRSWCVVVAPDIKISTLVRSIGTRPLVLLARDTLTIDVDGSIDVTGRASMTATAPGANPSGCVPPPSGLPDGGGGAGGTFGTAGGRGGKGATGEGGMPVPPLISDALRGGCDGGRGAAGGAMTAIGGRGGGAIYLLAGHRVIVEGMVNASGGGGDPGKVVLAGGGGGGGGAGGMILLGAPIVEVAMSAAVFANGGGGGGGSSILTGGASGATASSPASGGIGGAGGSAAATGGTGGFSSSSGANGGDGPSANDSGGGGGGGGVGRLRVRAIEQLISASTTSPPPS